MATASYEARKFGVRSAMSSWQALQLCPHLIFTHPRFEVYKQVSYHIREIFKRYTDKIDSNSAIDIAKEIKEAIKTELNLTASAGVSVNKFIAKIASDMNKPDGLTFIGPSKVISFLESLPVEKFFGVGKVTAAKMHRMGIKTGLDLKQKSETFLFKHFAKQVDFIIK